MVSALFLSNSRLLVFVLPAESLCHKGFSPLVGAALTKSEDKSWVCLKIVQLYLCYLSALTTV